MGIHTSYRLFSGFKLKLRKYMGRQIFFTEKIFVTKICWSVQIENSSYYCYQVILISVIQKSFCIIIFIHCKYASYKYDHTVS